MKRNLLFPLIVSLVIGVILVVVAVAYIISLTPSQPSTNLQCQTDSDCVPAQCCHARSVVNKANAPNCEGIGCTLECSPGTLDCGQGRPACVNNKCTINWNR